MKRADEQNDGRSQVYLDITFIVEGATRFGLLTRHY